MDTPYNNVSPGYSRSVFELDLVDQVVDRVENGHAHFRYRHSVLATKPRVLFDPSNSKHMKDFARFVKHNTWGDGCSYLLEDPYGDIPTMIRAKIADYYIAKYIQKVK